MLFIKYYERSKSYPRLFILMTTEALSINYASDDNFLIEVKKDYFIKVPVKRIVSITVKEGDNNVKESQED